MPSFTLQATIIHFYTHSLVSRGFCLQQLVFISIQLHSSYELYLNHSTHIISSFFCVIRKQFKRKNTLVSIVICDKLARLSAKALRRLELAIQRTKSGIRRGFLKLCVFKCHETYPYRVPESSDKLTYPVGTQYHFYGNGNKKLHTLYMYTLVF